MTIHRKTVELTCDTNGYAEDDATIHPYSSTQRLTTLLAVQVTSDVQTQLTVRQVDVGDEDTPEETPGDILLYIPETDERIYYVYVANGVDIEGTAVSTTQGISITTDSLRVEVDGGVSGDEVTVDLFYTTAGDQRF